MELVSMAGGILCGWENSNKVYFKERVMEGAV
jgi:hypothetical protein